MNSRTTTKKDWKLRNADCGQEEGRCGGPHHARAAAAACEGKRDFILFEPLDNAVKENRRLVLVLPLGTDARAVKQAQVYLASSLASWLKEQKTDGSGRPYGECKDEDPTLRKHFTREQILAIASFGREE